MLQCDCPPFDCDDRVRRYLAGETAAGDELARQFAPLVRALVQRVLGPHRRAEWEDACQTVFLRVFARLGAWKRQAPFCHWLTVVATRRAIDCLDLNEPFVQAKVEDWPARNTLDPDVVECIKSTVARWPPERRLLFEMMGRGASREEMAQRLGKSLRAIQYWVAAVRDELQTCLPEEEEKIARRVADPDGQRGL